MCTQKTRTPLSSINIGVKGRELLLILPLLAHPVEAVVERAREHEGGDGRPDDGECQERHEVAVVAVADAVVDPAGGEKGGRRE